jgi:hypothetical protein
LSKPRAILAEFPRSQVQVARCEHHPAPAHDTLVLALPGAGDVKFIVHRSARGDLDALNQVLGGPASS